MSLGVDQIDPKNPTKYLKSIPQAEALNITDQPVLIIGEQFYLPDIAKIESDFQKPGYLNDPLAEGTGVVTLDPETINDIIKNRANLTKPQPVVVDGDSGEHQPWWPSGTIERPDGSRQVYYIDPEQIKGALGAPTRPENVTAPDGLKDILNNGNGTKPIIQDMTSEPGSNPAVINPVGVATPDIAKDMVLSGEAYIVGSLRIQDSNNMTVRFGRQKLIELAKSDKRDEFFTESDLTSANKNKTRVVLLDGKVWAVK